MRAIQPVLVLSFAGSVAAAQPAPDATAAVTIDKPWSIGVEPRIGFTKPTSKLGVMAVGGIEIDVVLPPADHRLVLGLDVSLTRPSYSASASDPRIPGGMTTYEIKQTEAVVGVVLDYRIAPATNSLVPHVGLGPVMHLLKTNETAAVAPGENTATQTKPGFELEGGLDIKAGPGLVAGDVRIIYSGLDTPLTGSSNAGNLELALGYRLVF